MRLIINTSHMYDGLVFQTFVEHGVVLFFLAQRVPKSTSSC